MYLPASILDLAPALTLLWLSNVLRRGRLIACSTHFNHLRGSDNLQARVIWREDQHGQQVRGGYRRATPALSADGGRFDVMARSLADSASGTNTQK